MEVQYYSLLCLTERILTVSEASITSSFRLHAAAFTYLKWRRATRTLFPYITVSVLHRRSCFGLVSRSHKRLQVHGYKYDELLLLSLPFNPTLSSLCPWGTCWHPLFWLWLPLSLLPWVPILWSSNDKASRPSALSKSTFTHLTLTLLERRFVKLPHSLHGLAEVAHLACSFLRY